MTTRSIAAHERRLRTAQRESDINRVTALERALVNVHRETFPKAQRKVLPPPEPVDPETLRSVLEAEAGIPDLIKQVGSGDSLPVAPDPEPVDRYQLMREFRQRRRQGIPFWRIRDHIDVAREADQEAEEAGNAEVARREAAQAAEQRRLDGLWSDLQQARAVVAEELPGRVTAEQERRATARSAEQQELDEAWARLQANDPEVTLPELNRTFEDNEAAAKATKCNGNRTSVVVQFFEPEAIVPERKPARTPTGKRTLKKRTKTEVNALYVKALGSNVFATVKETFAVAPGTELIELVVVRRETDKSNGQIGAIYFGEFDRAGYEGASPSDPGKALHLVPKSMLNLKGKTEQVAPLDLKERRELAALL
jgi:hypothetical protein